MYSFDLTFTHSSSCYIFFSVQCSSAFITMISNLFQRQSGKEIHTEKLHATAP